MIVQKKTNPDLSGWFFYIEKYLKRKFFDVNQKVDVCLLFPS
jgi:hypothetical protein